MILRDTHLSSSAHHAPASIDQFGGVLEKADGKLHELVVVVEAFGKQNLAYDVGCSVVEQHLGVSELSWRSNMKR